MNNSVGYVAIFLVAVALATTANAQNTPAPEQVHGKRSGTVQPDQKRLPNKVYRGEEMTVLCAEQKNCDFRRPPKPRSGPCQGGMCPPGEPDKGRPVMRPQQSRSR